MKAFIGKSTWLEEGGGYEVRENIQHGVHWERLDKLANIFYGARFARNYVRDPERGVPFLSSSDMLLADIRGVPFLSLENTLPNLMKSLVIRFGWTLISRSGTIGRTVFVRGEMDEMTASEHVIRVVPENPIVRPGYLFAFLTSVPAQAMIKQKTYGNVIQHIEPEHIADLPVPIPDPEKQQRIHDLVVSTAQARTEANTLLKETAAYFDGLVGPMYSSHDHTRVAGIIQYSHLNRRLDAFYHIGWAAEACFDNGERIDDLATVISTNRVPRIYVQHGIPFLSGIDIFQVRPTARVHLAGYIADRFEARVRGKDIAIQGSGQRYGLLGHPAYIGTRLDGWAASHDLFRIRAFNTDDTARIYAFLRSDSGHRAMLRHSYGTSIPHVNPEGIASVRVPSLPPNYTVKAARALQMIEQADADEELAIREVEQWVNSSH